MPPRISFKAAKDAFDEFATGPCNEIKNNIFYSRLFGAEPVKDRDSIHSSAKTLKGTVELLLQNNNETISEAQKWAARKIVLYLNDLIRNTTPGIATTQGIEL
jgi:hypothetical protein